MNFVKDVVSPPNARMSMAEYIEFNAVVLRHKTGEEVLRQKSREENIVKRFCLVVSEDDKKKEG